MRNYWIETLLIAALFGGSLGLTLAHADNNTTTPPDYVYGDKKGVVPDYVYGKSGDNTNGNVSIAVTPRGTAIQIKPLDASGNPYAKQYNDFDRSLYNSLDTTFTQGVMTHTVRSANGTTRQVVNSNFYYDPVTGTTRVPVLVDENGFMIPTSSADYIAPEFVQPGGVGTLEEDTTVAPAATTSTATTTTTVKQGSAKVAVKGETRIREHIPAVAYTKPMTEAEYKKFRAAQLEVAAQLLPPIPTWVEALHPTSFMLLPNGGVVVPVTGAADTGDSTTVTVYGPTGEAVGTASSLAEYHKFFAKNYDTIVAQARAKGWDVVEHNGYIVLRSRDTRKVQAVFDWDGKPVELTTELQPRPYYFTPLRWEGVAPVAVEQRKIPAAGRKPGSQATAGTEHQTDNNPNPDPDVQSSK